MKEQFDEELFVDKRSFEEKVDPEDGETWRHFKSQTRKEVMTDMDPLGIGSGPVPAFEETMLLDTIRAMRRDRKDHAKRRQKDLQG